MSAAPALLYRPRRTDPCVACRRPLGDGPTAGAGAYHPECLERLLHPPDDVADLQLTIYDAPATSDPKGGTI